VVLKMTQTQNDLAAGIAMAREFLIGGSVKELVQKIRDFFPPQ